MSVIRFSLRRKLVYGRYFFRVKIYTGTRSRYTHGKLPIEEKNA
jgi:hypothetical protein